MKGFNIDDPKNINKLWKQQILIYNYFKKFKIINEKYNVSNQLVREWNNLLLIPSHDNENIRVKRRYFWLVPTIALFRYERITSIIYRDQVKQLQFLVLLQQKYDIQLQNIKQYWLWFEMNCLSYKYCSDLNSDLFQKFIMNNKYLNMLIMMMQFYIINSQIYSLEENTICQDIGCDQGDYTTNLYNFGSEHYDGLNVGQQFSLQCIFDIQFLVFVRINLDIVTALGGGFILSVMNGNSILLTIAQKDLNTFKISEAALPDASKGAFQSTNWYQIYITDSKIFISDWSQTLNYVHSITFSSSHRFNFFTQSSLSFWTGQACCIIMYKGILVDNTYFNSQLYIQSNTKYPETIIDINIQEKLQSNITHDYSDYQHIVRLGKSFDFDYSDPYLLDDSLLFNGSQYLNAYDVYLNYQYTLEFRMKLTSLTQIIQLFNFQQLSYYLRVSLKPTLIVEFDLNGQTSQFTLQSQSQLHFCTAIIYYLDDIRLQYSIQFIEFSNSGILTQQSYYKQSPTQFQNGQGTITIGSSLNQFNTGEYLQLYHFRFYQGYFIDDKSVIDPLCQIFLNDRCIICKPGYQLQENNQCQIQCSQLQQKTYFNSQHNQCIRQCHTTCATCSSPAICLTCSGNRLNPPNCDCPNGYFDDFVSPNCRKYIQDIQTQTGQVLLQCSATGTYQCQDIYFIYQFNTPPKVGIFLIGASQNVQSTQTNCFVDWQGISTSSFKVCVLCSALNQFYQIQWASSVGQKFPYVQESDQVSLNTNLLSYPQINYAGLQTYPQILGWGLHLQGIAFDLKVESNLNQILFTTTNMFSDIKYNIVYTSYQAISYTDLNPITLDNMPKSIKWLNIFQGQKSIRSTGTFRLMLKKRTTSSLSLNSRLPVINQYGTVLFITNLCQSGSCNFYESYITLCEPKFSLCTCEEKGYFINGSGSCAKCHPICYLCSVLSTQCTQCQPYQNKQLVNAQCICLTNQYQDNNKICQDCDPTCLTCTVSSSNCQTCIQFAFIQNGNCLCSNDRYFDFTSLTCNLCHPNCLTCLSDQIYSCLSCDSGKSYNELGHTCDCSIMSQYFDINFVCQNCHHTCATCSSSLRTHCLSCNNPRILMKQSLTTYECICKSGYFTDNSEQCIQCLPQCVHCDNAYSCSQCFFTREFDQIIKKCVCLEGYFEIFDEQLCNKCPIRCSKCENNNQCSECIQNAKLINSICECQSQFYFDGNNCIYCNTQLALSIRSCWINNCGDGILNYGEECDDGNQDYRDGCSYCIQDKGYQCSNQLLQISYCYQCQSNCNQCEFINQIIICNKCNDGYFLEQNQCIKCNVNCKTCNSFDHCSACFVEQQQLSRCLCPFGFYFYNQTCSSICGDGIKSTSEQCDDGNLRNRDGCDQFCNTETQFQCNAQRQISICQQLQNIDLIVTNTFKQSNANYKFQIQSQQMVLIEDLQIQIKLRNGDQKLVGYLQLSIEDDQNSNSIISDQWFQASIQYDKSNFNKLTQIEFNLSINFKQSIQNPRIIVQITSQLFNEEYNKIEQNPLNIDIQSQYVLSDVQEQLSSYMSKSGQYSTMCTIFMNMMLFLFQGTSNLSLMMRATNQIIYIKYMKIEFPPNLQLFLQDQQIFNIFEYLNVLDALNQFKIGFQINFDYIYPGEQFDLYNNNANFMQNILPFFVLLIIAKLYKYLFLLSIYATNHMIEGYDNSLSANQLFKIKVILIYRYYAFKIIQQLNKTQYCEIFEQSQYNIAFAIFLQLKNQHLDTVNDIICLILSLAFIQIYLVSIYQGYKLKHEEFNYNRFQSMFIKPTYLINSAIYIFCIVFLINFSICQVIITSFLSMNLYFLLIQLPYKENKLNIQGFIEESCLLITFITFLLYIYNPSEIDYISIGFVQVGFILIILISNMITTLTIVYNNLKRIRQEFNHNKTMPQCKNDDFIMNPINKILLIHLTQLS
ncbi:hypothetical protein pb186bvf_014432 [Paramecium bursaria]